MQARPAEAPDAGAGGGRDDERRHCLDPNQLPASLKSVESTALQAKAPAVVTTINQVAFSALRQGPAPQRNYEKDICR